MVAQRLMVNASSAHQEHSSAGICGHCRRGTARYGQSCVLLTWVLTVGALGLIVGVGLWYVAGGEIARHGRDSGADRTMRRHLTCVEMGNISPIERTDGTPAETAGLPPVLEVQPQT